MYRSFVICDDPKGVVECGTIRRSKSGSQKMKHKIESHRTTHNNSNTSLTYKKEREQVVSKGMTEGYRSPSSFQLLEVSRGAQKLNQMIDSWSKGQRYNGQSKDIAKDLLKGALDLQESLILLGKLQEASEYMAQLNKKQKAKLQRGRIDELQSERMNSHRFEDQNYQMGFQKPQLSADGSSRDCIEELKKAIQDGLARQNLLPHTVTRENTHFNRRRAESASDTGSSQSSLDQFNNGHSIDSHSLHTAPWKRINGPSLIAKLMGLEDIPSKPLRQTPKKWFDSRDNLNQRQPVFDIEMPKVRKPQPITRKVDSEQRTLDEILETMQFKGLLNSSSVKTYNSQSHHSSNSRSDQRLIDDIPPIVLIKPIRVPYLKSEEPLAPMVWKEEVLSTRMMRAKVKVEEWHAPRSMEFKEGTSISCKMHCKTEAEETPIKRLSQVERTKDYREIFVRPEEEEVKTVDWKEEAMNANKINGELGAEQSPMKQLSQGQWAKDHKELVVRTEEKEVRTKLKASSKANSSSPVMHQRQRRETSDKKVDKIQKVVATSGKPVERKIVKPKHVSQSQDQAKVTSTKPRKPENGSMSTNNQLPQHSTTPKTISRHTIKAKSHNGKHLKKKERPVSESTADKLTTENLRCKEDIKSIDLTCNNDSVVQDITPMPTGYLSTVEEPNASEFPAEEHCTDSQGSLCNVTLLSSECEKDDQSPEVADDQIGHFRTDGTNFKTGSPFKALLLSSPSFLTRAEEIFHPNASCPKILPATGIYNFEVTDMKLYLDYANECLERLSLPDSQTRHPLLPTYVGNLRISLSLDQLVEEVCQGVETLRNYGKPARDTLPADNLFATLERDISCKEVVSGMWDWGWRNGFSVDEAEQAVIDIEKLLVSELIEEVFT